MRHPPTLTYSGLTIILDHPSRHDKMSLISGWAGQFFDSCLMPLSRISCDIRDSTVNEPFLPNTRVVLHLGEESLHLVKPGDSLNEERGCPFTVNDIIRFASYAPQDAFDRMNYEKENEESETETTSEKNHQKTKRRNWRFWLLRDTRKAVRLLQGGLQLQRNFQYRIYAPAEEIINALLSGSNQELYLDIETDRSFNLTCFGFSRDGETVYVVPWKRSNNTLAYDERLALRIIQALAVAMGRNRVIVHNACFDLFVLAYKYRIPFPRSIYCTMLGWARCHPEVEKSLGHLISTLTDEPYHKNDGVFDPKNREQEEQLWRYNGKDISTLIQVYKGLQREIVLVGAEKSVEQVQASIRPYLTMQFFGMKLDEAKYLRRFQELENARFQYDRILRVITGRNLNPRSSQQVGKYLYTDLGFPLPEDDPTNEKTLLKLLTKHEIPSVKVILASRGNGKLASSLKFRFWSKDRGVTYDRLTTAYHLAGTDTFRLASRALLKFKPDKGFGTNVQNWEKGQRDLVIADEGKILGQTDQAGAEALIVAYLCRMGRFRSLFLHKIKPHTYIAMRIFHAHWASLLGLPNLNEYLECPIDKLKELKHWNEIAKLIKDDDDKYYVGKKTVHSSNYDIKGPTFQMSVLLDTEGKLVLSLKDCNMFLGVYRDTFKEIPEWHQGIQNELKTKGKVLHNLFGFPRRFLEPQGDSLFKQAYAFKPQSTVGCITSIAITELQEKIEEDIGGCRSKMGLDLLQNGHDSILWQCWVGFEVEAAKIVKSQIEKTFTHNGATFTMGSETCVGQNWSPYSEKNPEGLKEIKV